MKMNSRMEPVKEKKRRRFQERVGGDVASFSLLGKSKRLFLSLLLAKANSYPSEALSTKVVAKIVWQSN